jgi:hypothetical protein
VVGTPAIVAAMRHPVRDTRRAIVTAADEVAATARLARVALLTAIAVMIGAMLWLMK